RGGFAEGIELEGNSRLFRQFCTKTQERHDLCGGREEPAGIAGAGLLRAAPWRMMVGHGRIRPADMRSSQGDSPPKGAYAARAFGIAPRRGRPGVQLGLLLSHIVRRAPAA